MNSTQPGRPSPVSTMDIIRKYQSEIEMAKHGNPPDQRAIDLTGVAAPIVGTVTAPILENRVSLKGRVKKGAPMGPPKRKTSPKKTPAAASGERKSLPPKAVKGKRKPAKAKTSSETEKKARLTKRAPMGPPKRKTSVVTPFRLLMDILKRPKVPALYRKLEQEYKHLSPADRKWRIHTGIALKLIQGGVKMQEGVVIYTSPSLVDTLETLVCLDNPKINSISPIIRVHLAVLYANGYGVERNPEKAEFHLNTFTRHPESRFYYKEDCDRFFQRIMRGFRGCSDERAQRVNTLCRSWQKDKEKAKEFYLATLLINLGGEK